MFQFRNGIRGQQRSGWKRQERMQLSNRRIPHQFVNICALQWVRASHYEYGRAELGKLIDQLPCLQRAEFQWIMIGLDPFAIVQAWYIASLGGFPNGN